MIFEGFFEYGTFSSFSIQQRTENKILLKSLGSYVSLELGEKMNTSVRLVFEIEHGFLIVKSDSGVLAVSNQEEEPVALQEFLKTSDLDLGLTVKRNGEIHVSRNTFGTIPIYYFHLNDNLFAFSTQLASLVQKSPINQFLSIDKDTVSKYCIRNYNAVTKYDSATFFEKVKSGLPGYILVVTPSSVINRRYISFNLERYSSYDDRSQYSTELRHLLTNSVVQSTYDKPIGTHLSGGLDSSTISALAKLSWPDKELATYYSIAETNTNPDRDYADMVSSKIESVHYRIAPKTNDFELLDHYTRELGFPTFSVSSLAKTHAILEHGQMLGIKIMLTGHFGDEIIGKGFPYLKELFQKSEWSTLNDELEKRINDPSNHPLAKNFVKLSLKKRFTLIKSHYLSYRFINLADEKGIKSLPIIIKAVRYFDLSIFYVCRKLLINWLRRLPYFAENISITKKGKSFTEGDGDMVSINTNGLNPAHLEYLNDIYTKNIVNLCEEYFALGNLYGIDIKFPFLNKEVMELCAATPEKYKYYIGSGRGHLRRAMDGLLPEAVLTREDKAYFTHYARESAKRLIIQSKDVLGENSPVWEYINYNEYLKIEDAILKDRKRSKYYSKGSLYVVKAIALHIWFDWVSSISKTGKTA